jgi:hypothetical protein
MAGIIPDGFAGVQNDDQKSCKRPADKQPFTTWKTAFRFDDLRIQKLRIQIQSDWF